MDKPFLFLEDLLEILPLCLSEDSEISILGKELLDTYDCCLFPVTMFLLNMDKYDEIPFSMLSSKIEEKFLGKIACDAWKRENFYSSSFFPEYYVYRDWWYCPMEKLRERLELFK